MSRKPPGAKKNTYPWNRLIEKTTTISQTRPKTTRRVLHESARIHPGRPTFWRHRVLFSRSRKPSIFCPFCRKSEFTTFQVSPDALSGSERLQKQNKLCLRQRVDTYPMCTLPKRNTRTQRFTLLWRSVAAENVSTFYGLMCRCCLTRMLRPETNCLSDTNCFLYRYWATIYILSRSTPSDKLHRYRRIHI